MSRVACGRPPPCGAPGELPRSIQREDLDELTRHARLTPAEARSLYARFRRLAPDGYLLPEQFKQTMGVLGLSDDSFMPDRMFKVFDKDQDGRLSFLEFAASLATMIRGTEDEKLKLSFEMTAGERGASGISLLDFQRLITACNNMMSSLMAPSDSRTTEEDVRRLFDGLSSSGLGEGGTEPIITLEAYKAAAKSNEDFLMYLGLEPWRSRGTGPKSSSCAGAWNRGCPQTVSSRRPSGSGPCVQAAGAQEHVAVPAAQLEELRQRVQRIGAMIGREAPGGVRRQGAPQGRAPAAALSASSAASRELRKALRPRHRLSLGEELLPSISEEEEDEAGGEAAAPLCELVAELERAIQLWSHGDEQALWAPARHVLGDAAGDVAGVAAADLETATMSHRTDRTPRFGLTLDFPVSPMSTELAPNGDSGRSGPLARTTSGFSMPVRSASGKTAVSEGVSVDAEGHLRTPPVSPATSTRRATATFSRSPRQKTAHRLLGPKKGLSVHFGHENWNMVISMMVGIRMAVGRCKNEFKRELQPVDFIMKEKFSIVPRLANIFDSAVSKRVTVTRFIDYAPMAFQSIRASFGINDDEYARSMGPEGLLGNMVLGNLASLSELSSEGKSGAFFYYTADGRYMLKTVTPKEFHLLKGMLMQYHRHISQHPETLIVRFLGLHCLRVLKKRKTASIGKPKPEKLYFVVMSNMFNAPFEIHRRYDLKGSWVGRETPLEKQTPGVALKDVDFLRVGEKIGLGEERRARLLATLEMDSRFLASNNIIDYSLLLGIHDLKGGCLPDDFAGDLGARMDLAGGCPVAPLTTPRGTSGAQPLHQRDAGGVVSKDRQALYFMGVIDILTPYDALKRAEHCAKSIRYFYSAAGISCCPPGVYAERFNKFMQNIIT